MRRQSVLSRDVNEANGSRLDTNATRFFSGKDLGQISRRTRAPEPINSDIVRDHFIEIPGCYNKTTCLPVHPSHRKRHEIMEWDEHQCLLSWKHTESHDDCCFFHSLGMVHGWHDPTEVYNLQPQGCSKKDWPDDTRYYEGRLDYAQLEG